MTKSQTIAWANANNVQNVYRYVCPATKSVTWVATNEENMRNMQLVWSSVL